MKNLILPILFIFILKPLSSYASLVKKPLLRKSIIACKTVCASESEDDEDDDEDDENEAKVLGTSVSAAMTDSMDDEEDDKDEDDDEDEDGDGAKEDAAKNKNISANIKIISDYIYRGLTATDHQPAIQGGIDWEHESGFFFGTWGSSVHFPDTQSSMELDLYGGYSLTLFKNVEVSLSLQRFTYFANDGLNSWGLTEKNVWHKFVFETSFSPHWKGEGNVWYLSLGWEDQIANLFKLGVFGGYTFYPHRTINTIVTEQTVDANDNEIEVKHSAIQQTPNYSDFRISLSKEVFDVTLEASGIFVKKQKIEGSNASSRFLIGISRTF